MTTTNGHGCRRCDQGRRTACDVLLLAAMAILEDGRGYFSPADLAVEAARLDPLRFCQKTANGELYNHPSDNRTMMELSNKRSPLRARALIQRVGQCQYKLTDAGRDAARAIRQGVPS